jgi:hypothetical protein
MLDEDFRAIPGAVADAFDEADAPIHAWAIKPAAVAFWRGLAMLGRRMTVPCLTARSLRRIGWTNAGKTMPNFIRQRDTPRAVPFGSSRTPQFSFKSG